MPQRSGEDRDLGWFEELLAFVLALVVGIPIATVVLAIEPATPEWALGGISLTTGYAGVLVFLRVVGEISTRHAVVGIIALAALETILLLLLHS